MHYILCAFVNKPVFCSSPQGWSSEVNETLPKTTTVSLTARKMNC